MRVWEAQPQVPNSKAGPRRRADDRSSRAPSPLPKAPRRSRARQDGWPPLMRALAGLFLQTQQTLPGSRNTLLVPCPYLLDVTKLQKVRPRRLYLVSIPLQLPGFKLGDADWGSYSIRMVIAGSTAAARTAGRRLPTMVIVSAISPADR